MAPGGGRGWGGAPFTEGFPECFLSNQVSNLCRLFTVSVFDQLKDISSNEMHFPLFFCVGFLSLQTQCVDHAFLVTGIFVQCLWRGRTAPQLPNILMLLDEEKNNKGPNYLVLGKEKFNLILGSKIWKVITRLSANYLSKIFSQSPLPD